MQLMLLQELTKECSWISFYFIDWALEVNNQAFMGLERCLSS